jgi:hypothetical protein
MRRFRQWHCKEEEFREKRAKLDKSKPKFERAGAAGGCLFAFAATKGLNLIAACSLANLLRDAGKKQ